MAAEVDRNKDLPLMANANDIRARHYLLKLNPKDRIFECEVILFFEPLTDEKLDLDFECVLDCCDLNFEVVEEILIFGGNLNYGKSKHFVETCFLLPRKRLRFRVEEWAIRITKPGCKSANQFPKMVYLKYQTKPEGKSLMWRQDQNGNDCVFTPASPINNRALFPCQEPPIAMANWQAVITAPNACVLCTGDQDGVREGDSHYFYTEMTLPMSTFALAVGHWESHTVVADKECSVDGDRSRKVCPTPHDPYPCHIARGDSGPLIPCRIVAPEGVSIHPCVKRYIKASLKASYNLLGSHPFLKLDVLVLPRCYSGLGLASPNLVFVSQTLIKAQVGHPLTSMLVRFSHEISHSWFGLVIGALDWTEEWLSEGFATFCEDYIHEEALDILHRENPNDFSGFYGPNCAQETSKLRGYIRYLTLVSEIDNSDDEDLQKLRPMEGHQLKDLQKNVAFVKNGLNPQISFTQVHYLKGFFLLQ